MTESTQYMDNKSLALAEFEVLTTGNVDLAKLIAHPDWLNSESEPEPSACSQRGPKGMLAVGAWLRYAFSELTFEVHKQVGENNSVWSHVTMKGKHTGAWVIFPPNSSPLVFPPSHKTFQARQVHLHIIEDGLIKEHGAVRDDLSMMSQLGFFTRPTQQASDETVINEVQIVTTQAANF